MITRKFLKKILDFIILNYSVKTKARVSHTASDTVLEDTDAEKEKLLEGRPRIRGKVSLP